MNAPQRFPKRSAWSQVDRIRQLCEALDPGDPEDRYDCVNDPRRYQYVERRHADLERVYGLAVELCEAIRFMR